MMKKKELSPIALSDLQSIGINAALTQNDLVEVIAHDIYEKFMSMIDNLQQERTLLRQEIASLFDPEIDEMMKTLVSAGLLTEDEIRETSKSYQRGPGTYWPSSSYLSSITMKEMDRGTVAKLEQHDYNFSHPNLEKTKSTSVLLSVSVKTFTSEKEELTGKNAIRCEIEKNVKKSFCRVITATIPRFREMSKKIYSFNEKAERVISILPKTGVISVERFTREARVKINKSIISQQSADFKSKMESLFNISL